MQLLLSQEETAKYLAWLGQLPYACCRLRFIVVDRKGRAILLEGKHMAFRLQVDHKLPISIANPVDRYGNPAAVDGIPSWALSDAGFGDLTAATGGMSAEFIPNGILTPAGSVLQVQVTADADLGAGVEPISGVLELTLVAGKAVGLVISPGTPAPF